MSEANEWRTSAASTIDIIRNLSRIMFEFQVDLNALKATMAETDARFEERFTRHHQAAERALADARSVTLQLLEKTAAKLRNDPSWTD
jgi:uncharacterized protein (DUF305 family)